MQGQVDGLQFLRKLTEAQTNPTTKYMVSQVAKAYEMQLNTGQLGNVNCVDVELTYVETQWYRLKRAILPQDPAE